MEYTIRELKPAEIPLLHTFLYEAIYQPEGTERLPFDVVYNPALSLYVDDWGRPGDYCLLLEVNRAVVGAAWSRLLPDGYGRVDPATPELSISLLPAYRHTGLGSALLSRMLESLRQLKYLRVSLSVSKGNYAAAWYEKSGFRIYMEREEDYVMLLDL